MKMFKGVKITKTEIAQLLHINSQGYGINYHTHLKFDPLALAVLRATLHMDGELTKKETIDYLYANMEELLEEDQILLVAEAIKDGTFSHDPENGAEFLIHPDGEHCWYLGQGETSDNVDLPLDEVINTDDSGNVGYRLCHVCPAKEVSNEILLEDFRYTSEHCTTVVYRQY